MAALAAARPPLRCQASPLLNWHGDSAADGCRRGKAQWQGENKAGSTSRHILSPDASSMSFNDCTHNRQAQTTSTGDGPAREIGAVKTIKYSRQGTGGYTLTAVCNGYFQVIIALYRIDSYRSSRGRMVQRIIAEV